MKIRTFCSTMRRKRLLILFLALGCVCLWLVSSYDSWISSSCWTQRCRTTRDRQNRIEEDDQMPEGDENGNSQAHLVKKTYTNWSTTCNIPKLDPFEPSILNLIKDYGDDAQCQGSDLHFAINSRGMLTIRKKEYRPALKLHSTKLSYIVRPEDNDDSYYIGPELYPFKKDINKKIRKMSSDFVRLTYQRKEDDKELVHYIARVAAKKEILLRSQKARNSNPAGIPLNILMFGFDSSSNAMVKRKLPKTYDYLKNGLDAYFFNGYAAIGDGTTPILTALLTGKFINEIVKDKKNKPIEDLNLWPWIMKDYSKHGYVSLYAEDDQKIAAFNIRMNGFRKAPSDHYMRPFWLALEDHKLRKAKRKNKFPDNNIACLGSEALHNITLDYLYSMFDAYPNTPKFGFAFMSYLSHGVPDKLSYADNDFVGYLKRYKKHQNNTVLIMLSDHGARIGPVRNTIQGSLEERLPFLSIVLPKWFQKQYPVMAANMRENKDIVTTAFDVHATLRHLLSYPNIDAGQKTQSLFTKIPAQRSCANAGIDYHYCPCLSWKHIPVHLPEVKHCAKAIVNLINLNIAKSEYSKSKCAPIVLENILSAAEVQASQPFSNPIKNGRARRRRIPNGRRLQILVETSPLKGLFEGTVVIRSNGRIVVNSHVSRTNVYGNNPHCVVDQHPELRKFCVCKDKLENEQR